MADRLEQVHRGLGEMQTLARDVGSLNRVLTNVKTRGVFGEMQLAGLLEQVFTPEQYATNVATVRPAATNAWNSPSACPGSAATVRRCGCPSMPSSRVRTTNACSEAQDRADPLAVEGSGQGHRDMRLRLEARSIREKYVSPPHTTDFGILFVPTEGLYAEALRRPGSDGRRCSASTR